MAIKQAVAKAPEHSMAAIPDAGTVTVACNVVNGLKLKTYEMEESEEPVLGGGTRIRQVAVETGDFVVIKGPRYSAENQQRGPRAYGYVLTHGVSAAFMQRWMKDNARTLLVQNSCVLVHKNDSDAKAAAKDCKDFKSGLEPIKPGMTNGKPNDLRIPRPLKTAIGGVSGIETDEATDE
jgi:hypothetical protein